MAQRTRAVKKTSRKRGKDASRTPAGSTGAKTGVWSGSGTKCVDCEALCCKYISVEIDAPEDQESVDHLRWFLYHDKVSIYIQDGQWHLCVDVRCKQLKDDKKCRIHYDKPDICKGHGTDECEFGNPDFKLDAEFKDWDDLRTYLKRQGFPQ